MSHYKLWLIQLFQKNINHQIKKIEYITIPQPDSLKHGQSDSLGPDSEQP